MQRMMTFLRLTSLLFLAAKMRSLRFTLPHGAAELNSFSCQVLPIHRNGLEKNVLSTRLKFSNLVEWNRLSMVKKLLLFPGILPDLIAHFIEMSSEKMNFQHGWNFRISLNGIDWAWCQDNVFFCQDNYSKWVNHIVASNWYPNGVDQLIKYQVKTVAIG